MTATCQTSRTVKLINPLEDPNWDARLLSHPGYSFFHSSGWARVMWQTYGYEPVYLTVLDGNRLLATMPVMEASSWLKARRGVSLPFTDFCELLDTDGLLHETVLPEALKLGQHRGWKYLEFRGVGDGFAAAPRWDRFAGHELALTADSDELFGKFDSSVRRAIRKSEREGVKTEITHELDGVRQYYALHCQTRRKHGLPPQSFEFFENIHRYIIARELGFVCLARWQGTPIAGAVFFNLGTRAIYKFGASDLRFQQLRGTNLLFWEAIQWYAQHGCKSLHFGRTDLPNEGLRRFKCGWGAMERMIDYVRYDFGKRDFIAGETREETGLANRVFQILPVSVSRVIGKLAYGHMG